MDRVDIQVATRYSSISSNVHGNLLDCRNDLLIYARSFCPVVFNLITREKTLLLGHKGEVNITKFINKQFNNVILLDRNQSKIDASPDEYLVSASLDNTAIIWKINISNKQGGVSYEKAHILKDGIGNQFLAIDSRLKTLSNQTCQSDSFVTVTSSINGTICVWTNDIVVFRQKVDHCGFDIRIFTKIIDSCTSADIVFIGGTDNKLHTYFLRQESTDSEISLNSIMDSVGHKGWIKSLDCIQLPGIEREHDSLVATASLDGHIRVWHLKFKNIDDDNANAHGIDLSEPICIKNSRWVIQFALETVLSGHDDSVFGVRWFPCFDNLSIKLISCSADKTVIVWSSKLSAEEDLNSPINQYKPATKNVWNMDIRYGERGEANLPFVSVCPNNLDEQFYSTSFRGAIHCCALDKNLIWKPYPSITGHSRSITDLSWCNSGHYLISSSNDKTCRVHTKTKSNDLWYEIARPQVHGYEINCVVSLGFDRFISGSEEKTIREYTATQFFLNNYSTLACETVDLSSINDSKPSHAQLPALGLSSKAADKLYDFGADDTSGDATNPWSGKSQLYSAIDQAGRLDSNPIEEVLMYSTLWYETKKLYGHGNEIFALAADKESNFLASASKSNKPDFANIIIWNINSKYRKVANLSHHSLTITRLRFSPDSKYLLSVSRDRTLALFERYYEGEKVTFKLIFGTSKSNSIHERIIWDCCWTSDSKFFMTVSRDKQAVIWSVDEITKLHLGNQDTLDIKTCAINTRLFHQSIQASDSPNMICQKNDRLSYIFALGFEDGTLIISSVIIDKDINWSDLIHITNFHHLPIRRLSFRPKQADTDELLLASGGDDCIVKITAISI